MGARRARPARRRLRRCCSRRRARAPVDGLGRRVHGGRRADRLHARAAPRARRRPHRGDRQHDAQAHGRRASGRSASGCSSRSGTRRSCSCSRSCSGSACGRWPGRSRDDELDAAHGHGRDRAVGLGRVPAADRRGQPQRARRHRAGVPGRASRGDRARPRSSPSARRSAGPMSRVLGRFTRAVTRLVADVPARRAVRARLRHRDRGRAAVPRGRRGGRRAAVVRGPDAAGPVRRRACRCSTRSTARS